MTSFQEWSYESECLILKAGVGIVLLCFCEGCRTVCENKNCRTRFTLCSCKASSDYFRHSAGYLMKPDAISLELVVVDLKSLIFEGSRWCLVYMIILVTIHHWTACYCIAFDSGCYMMPISHWGLSDKWCNYGCLPWDCCANHQENN